MDEYEEDEDLDIEEFEYEPPSFPYDPTRLLVDVAALAAGLSGVWSAFFMSIAQDLAANVNHRNNQRDFHMAAAREIETITEEQSSG